MPDKIDDLVQKVWKDYQKGLSFNAQQDLDETVRTNENFFIGKQWEGVEAGGLPTPVFNFLKRVVLFTIAGILSNNIKLQTSAFSVVVNAREIENMTNVVNAEFERILEKNQLISLLREYLRNAAVDGDGCTYTYWNPDIETGQKAKGAIVTEIIENTRVFFGNGNSRVVQKQPYIIISSREMLDEVKDRAKEFGASNTDGITVDTDDRHQAPENITDDKVTVLLKLWKDKKTKTIHAIETTRNAIVRPEWDTGLTLYPVTWLNWDYIQDNYHGQSMITGLIPNQIFINKLFAMSMISLMTTAYPKIIYDKTRLPKWDNRVGAAIGINGGDVNNAAKIMSGATIDPQVAQFIDAAIRYTQSFLGATDVAMGEGKAYNTSAIIALQKAATTPNELTRQNLYQSLEDLGRIYIDFMASNYGIRKIYAKASAVPTSDPTKLEAAMKFAEMSSSDQVPQDFDFSALKNADFTMKLDVGASSYWSEIAELQTLDNLLEIGKIDLVDYLERVPNGYIIKQQEWIEKLKKAQAQPLMLPQNSNMPPALQQATPANVGMQNFKQAAM